MRHRVAHLGALAAFAIAAAASTAAEARPASVGTYAEADLGAAGFLGQASQYSRVGPSFALRLGHDLFSWLSVGGRLDVSTHEATVPPPPEGEYFQLYGAGAEARLGFRVGAVALYADGGAGLSLISTNVLAKVHILDPGERFSLTFDAGGGAEYQLQNRHYAFGLAGTWKLLPAFGDSSPLSSASAHAYIRYTY